MSVAQIIALLSGIAGVLTAVTALLHSIGTRKQLNTPTSPPGKVPPLP